MTTRSKKTIADPSDKARIRKSDDFAVTTSMPLVNGVIGLSGTSLTKTRIVIKLRIGGSPESRAWINNIVVID